MSFAKLGSQHTVNATVAGDQDRSSVIQLLNGDIVVAWTDTNGAAINVRGQILNADGVTRDGSEFMLNTTLTGDQYDVSLTALGNGGFAAGWTSSADWSAEQSPFDLSRTSIENHVVTQVFNSEGPRSEANRPTARLVRLQFSGDSLLPTSNSPTTCRARPRSPPTSQSTATISICLRSKRCTRESTLSVHPHFLTW